MPFTHEWYNDEKKVIYSQVIGAWTWDEYIGQLDTISAMLDEVDHPVILLGDFSQSGPAPKGIITRMSQITTIFGHPNFDQFIVVAISSWMGKNGAQIFSRVFGALDSVDTLEQAEELIRERINR